MGQFEQGDTGSTTLSEDGRPSKSATLSDRVDLPRYTNGDIQGIRELEATGRLSRLWKRPKTFVLAVFLAWTLVPLLAFAGIGLAQGTLFIEDGHGVLEATTFLTYFPTSFLLIVAVTHALRTLRPTLNSLAGLARLDEDTEYLQEEQFRSRLSVAEMNQLFDFYEFVIAKMTFRGGAEGVALPGTAEWTPARAASGDAAVGSGEVSADGGAEVETDGGGPGQNVELLEDFERTWRRYFVYPLGLFVFGGLAFFVIAKYQHWYALETYDTELWSSQQHLVGYFARMGYDFMLYVIMGPYVASALLASIALMHHALTRMERKNGIRFLRFSIDEAGGFGQFGQQSLRNTFVLLPLIIPMAVSIVFLPVNALTLVGIAVFLGSIPLVFFWPLLGARRSMKRMKQMELEIISSSLIEQYEECKRHLELTNTGNIDNANALVENGEVIERAEVMYDGIKKQPAWPFSRSLLTQFASIMTAAAGLLGSLLGLFESDILTVFVFLFPT